MIDYGYNICQHMLRRRGISSYPTTIAANTSGCTIFAPDITTRLPEGS